MSDVMNPPAEAQPGTALAQIAPTNLVGAFAKKGGIEAIVAAVEVEARAQLAKLDVTKPKDRTAMKSLALKVSKSKVVLDDTGKDLGADAKKLVDTINADRKLGRDRLEALRDEVLARVEQFEQIEKDRVAAHEAALVEIINMGNVDGLASEEIKARLWEVPSIEARQWQEFVDKADRTIGEVLMKLTAAHAAAVEREAAEIEAERLRQVEAERIAAENERKRIEREEQIARDAAALATMQAEAKAEEARQAAALALAEAQLTAKRLADEAEANRIKGHRDALADLDAASNVIVGSSSATIRATLEAFKRRPARNWEEFGAEAEQDTAAALLHLETCLRETEDREEVETLRLRMVAEEKAAADAAAAVAAEQARVARIAAAQKAEEEARTRNVAHRKSVNRAALNAMMDLGVALTEHQCRSIIEAIVTGTIPAVTITY